MKKFLKISMIFILLTSYLVDADEMIHSSKPIEIDSNSSSINLDIKLATFTGNVRVVQDDIQITADTMIANYNNSDNKISKIEIHNNIVITKENQIIKGDEAIYDIFSNRIIMQGKVILIKDNNILKGNYLTYDLNKNEAHISSLGSKKADDSVNTGGRVRAVFSPNEQ